MKTLTKTRRRKVAYVEHKKNKGVSRTYPNKTNLVNEYWMRDWMEQLNYLRIDPVAANLTENDPEHLGSWAYVN